ncbi:MAG: PD40 domain-containing protein [Sedimentisphaerales bacterium]|nr:PD40 domain-containing protein [Sedimentisphaerales bacterium]
MKSIFAGILTIIVLANSTFAQEYARLLRFPAIYEDQLVFTYGGDLYSVSSKGGVARKLTTHPGYEMFARFSPDGQQLAFTGQYDGNTEVYLMPAQGGEPKRLTFTATLSRDDVSDRMGPNNIVMCWKNRDEKIVFRSRMQSFNSFIGQLYSVTTQATLPEQLPLPRGGFCSFSPDDKKMAYNRVFREFRTWKRYRGGMADDIWIYDFQSKQTTNITDNPAQDIIPMWHRDKIYFLSDRDENQRMNLYVYETKSQKTKKLTDFTDFDIKFPSLGKKAIVFENGGFIYRFDLNKNKCQKINISIQEDFSVARDALVDVDDKITNYEIAPDGKRALFGARGEVFTVPAKQGFTRNLTNSSAVHDRNSKWSPDGRYIAYISDATGEDEIYIIPQDGSAPAEQITYGAETYKYAIKWSPDSKKLLWADKRLRLRLVDVQNGDITEVDQSEAWEFNQYSWLPDSKWIVYTKAELETMSKIYLFSLEQNQSHEITDGWFDCSNPIFSSDGKFIFFASDRDFNPIYSQTEWNHAYKDLARIYLITLNKEVESPFKYENDEVAIHDDQDEKDIKEQAPEDDSSEVKKETGNEENDNDKNSDDDKGKDTDDDDDKNGKKPVEVKVDIDGIKGRIAALDIEASGYRNLRSVDKSLYYIRKGSEDKKSVLLRYDFKEKEEKKLGEISGYEISHDQKKMIVSVDKKYAIIDLPKDKLEIKKHLNLSEMQIWLNRKAQWQQIFNECWRQMREFFHVPNMHGVDWPAMQQRYQPLLEHVNHRMDLTYVIGEMIGELNAGHCYAGGGDYVKPKIIKTGLLGAVIERDTETGYFKIKKILPGQNWEKNVRSPLTEIGINAAAGDLILAVDSQATNEIDNFYKLLLNKPNKQVVLKLNSTPDLQNAREVIVVPIDDEASLYYHDWVQTNIEKVNQATDGKVGYIHVPDMGTDGLNEFVKHFYPQIRKKALIVDVRGNGGGNVSPMLIERLRREIVMIEFARNTAPRSEPYSMIYGPMICLADEFSASDGDLFTYQFKKFQLGKVVGKRTWGGVVGIRGSLPLLDGGTLRKPEFSRYDVEGKNWIIEGIGVEPDIFVDNDPALEYSGTDQQLNKAIEVILEQLKTEEKEIPPLPPYPVK